jgi:hypothetical protein
MYDWHKLFNQYLKLLIVNYNLTGTQYLIAWLNSQIFRIGVNVPLLLSDGTINGVNIRVYDIEAQFGTALDLDILEDTAHCALISSVCSLVTHPEDNSIAEMPHLYPITPATTPLIASPAIVKPSLLASSGLLSAPPSTVVELPPTAVAAVPSPAITWIKQEKTAPVTRYSTH